MRSTSAWMPGEATLCVLRHGAQRAEACPCSQLSLSAMEMSPYDAGCCAASGYTHRRFCPRPVRYTSATTLTRRTTAAHDETSRDKKKTARLAENSQLAGRFRRWWQVLGSNQRRLSRRFYRPFPLATRATCRSPACALGTGQAQRRIAQDASRCATRPPVSRQAPCRWRHRHARIGLFGRPSEAVGAIGTLGGGRDGRGGGGTASAGAGRRGTGGRGRAGGVVGVTGTRWRV